MSIFTKLAKQRLSWRAPETVASGAPEVDFLFSNGSDFVFSDGSDYVFKEATTARTPTAWVSGGKQRIYWVAPEVSLAVSEAVDYAFSDSSDFLFSDGSDYVFSEARTGRSSTAWTQINKSR